MLKKDLRLKAVMGTNHKNIREKVENDGGDH